MFTDNDYQLLDFGDGRRLERFGTITLDRPCPAAERMARGDPSAWQLADARFEGRNDEKGRWTYRIELPERWQIAHGAARFELKRTEFGHLGVFPEQAENWDWIALRCASFPHLRGVEAGSHRGEQSPLTPGPSPVSRARGDDVRPLSDLRARGDASQARRPLKVLNLFAYTGGSTLAAAAAGAEVTHVDAAKNVVAWARRNAELSGLAAAPVRWIVEDAAKFATRELKRGNRYDAVILDPPSYGHGPRGQVWRLPEHLPGLLAMCAELTDGRPEFMLLTCHTPGYEADHLRDLLHEAFAAAGHFAARPLWITSSTGRSLPCGVAARQEGLGIGD